MNTKIGPACQCSKLIIKEHFKRPEQQFVTDTVFCFFDFLTLFSSLFMSYLISTLSPTSLFSTTSVPLPSITLPQYLFTGSSQRYLKFSASAEQFAHCRDILNHTCNIYVLVLLKIQICSLWMPVWLCLSYSKKYLHPHDLTFHVPLWTHWSGFKHSWSDD